MFEFLSFLFKKRGNKRKEWEGWTRIGGWGWDETLSMENVPDWVNGAIRKLDLRAALYAGSYYELKGRHYRYRVVPLGQGVSDLWIFRKRRSKRGTNGQEKASDRHSTEGKSHSAGSGKGQ